MRTTLNIDDELVARAQTLTNITAKPKLIHEALKALVERESTQRLAHEVLKALVKRKSAQRLDLEALKALVERKSAQRLALEAPKALVERKSARRLAKLGGSQPALRSIPRRRFADDSG